MTMKDLIGILNRLVETSKDGEYGFRTSAEHLRRMETRQLFMARAEECRRAASELQAMVAELGGSAEDGGTTTGALHRGWVAVKSKLAGYTDLAILEEAERGEDVAMARYREALEDPQLTPAARLLVERQYEGVKRNHMQVRTLRDRERATAQATGT
ncbi:MAG TPA: PA2169 family four-helix-bundle protein [Burkholderiaceae bacterium]|nr:PA2169 family four-helix-bundle protein [Burkholderiaceae bacterium]